MQKRSSLSERPTTKPNQDSINILPLITISTTRGRGGDSLNTLQNRKQRQDEKHQRGPLDKLVMMQPGPGLVDEHGKEVEGDDGCSGGITFPAGERVGGGGGFEEDYQGGRSDDTMLVNPTTC